MVKIFKTTWLFILFLSFNSFATVTENEIVEISKVYNIFHGFTKWPNVSLKNLDKYKGSELESVSLIIKELLTENNEIFSLKYLTKPDTSTLKYFHIIMLVHYNMCKKSKITHLNLAKNLLNQKLSYNEALLGYYESIFISHNNNNKRGNDNKLNIHFDSLNLIKSSEKAIFFLEYVESFGFQAIAYIAYADTPNYKASYEHLQTLPLINSAPYYQFAAFDFGDFNFMNGNENISFKKYYLANYYNLLMAHYFSLQNLNKFEEMNEIFKVSILSKEKYYQYCNEKKILEDILQHQGD